MAGCVAKHKSVIKHSRAAVGITGEMFYRQAAAFSWQQRDSFALREILAGNIPSFLKTFLRIKTQVWVDNKKMTAVYYVMPDYLSIGQHNNFARIPLTPMAAQHIADKFHCFLPTTKIVDDVYASAAVKCAPIPMFAFRDSTPTFYQHHLMIEGQRQLRKGLIAGIKKDVVISDALNAKSNRVAIYGWHKPDGKPIQPLYTGHVNWYVDYSHGIRLVYEMIWINGKPMHYRQVLQNEKLRSLICKEATCSCYRYMQ